MCSQGWSFATTLMVSAARRSKKKKKTKDKEGVCKPGQDTMAVRGERGIEEERTKSRDER